MEGAAHLRVSSDLPSGNPDLDSSPHLCDSRTDILRRASQMPATASASAPTPFPRGPGGREMRGNLRVMLLYHLMGTVYHKGGILSRGDKHFFGLRHIKKQRCRDDFFVKYFPLPHVKGNSFPIRRRWISSAGGAPADLFEKSHSLRLLLIRMFVFCRV